MAKEAKINAKAVIREIKSKKIKMRNITFRLDPDLLKNFSDICDEEKVSGNKIIEVLIRNFIDSYPK
jgi:metal-responsive CopG/Arc/MetJ family transcriptional regulator